LVESINLDVALGTQVAMVDSVAVAAQVCVQITKPSVVVVVVTLVVAVAAAELVQEAVALAFTPELMCQKVLILDMVL
jgi:hypothetical protein